MKSMTGFGKGEGSFEGKKITIEVKTLNSKQFEMNCRIAPVYRSKELEFRAKVLELLERGKVDLLLTIDDFSKEIVPFAKKINAPLLMEYCKELHQIRSQINFPDSLKLLELSLNLPNVITHSVSDNLSEEEWDFVYHILVEALQKTNEFREAEGNILKKDLQTRIKFLKGNLEKVENLDVQRRLDMRKRLEDAFEGKKIENFDPNRFEQELIYYFEKLDISEEKVRLSKHLSYFEDVMRESSGNGKKLGFVAQEIGREINTIGSKANHAEMQRLVVEMKDELEKIKEQLLNIL